MDLSDLREAAQGKPTVGGLPRVAPVCPQKDVCKKLGIYLRTENVKKLPGSPVQV